MADHAASVSSRSSTTVDSTHVRLRRARRGHRRGGKTITTTAVLALMVLLVGPLTGSAAASAPERIVDDYRASFACPGGLVITEGGGHYEALVATRPVGRDLLRGNASATTKDVTASDQDGNRYRIVGSGGGTRLVSPTDGDAIQGQFGVRLVILAADGGRIGRVHLQGHLRADGTFTFADRGDCAEIGE
jgi:hypothetical protein